MKNVHWDTALVTCESPQVRRVMYHLVKVVEACGLHQAAIWLQDNCMRWTVALEGGYWQNSKWRRAVTGIRKQAAADCRIKIKTVPEPQCECTFPASAPREPKESARGRVCMLGRLDAMSATCLI